MKKISFMFVGGAFVIASQAIAQPAAEEAVDAVEETAEAAGEPVQLVIPPPAPPARLPPPPAPPPPISVPRGPHTDGVPNEIAAPPYLKNDRRNLFKDADYPPAAWIAGLEGTTRFSLAVGADGKPKDCIVTESSESLILDQATCDIAMERAEFEPSIGLDGSPIKGVYESSYRWRKKEPEMPEMRIVFQYLHTAKGVTTDCDIISIEGDIPEKMRAEIDRDRERGRLCSGPIGRPGIPYRDENGVPVAKRVTATINVVLEDPE